MSWVSPVLPVGFRFYCLLSVKKVRAYVPVNFHITFIRGGSSSILNLSCAPGSFFGRRDTPHSPPSTRLKRRSVPIYQRCGSRIRIFSIPDLGSRVKKILRSRIRIKEFKPKNLFPSSRKYDPGCSSLIRILIFYSSRIPDPGSRGQKDTGSATLQYTVPCTLGTSDFDKIS
jgi:hypothetical protein